MNVPLTDLPEEVSVLHQMIRDLVKALEEKDRDLEKLRHQLEQIQRYFYGRKSEKSITEPWLFLYAGLLDELERGEEEGVQEEPAELEPAPAAGKRRHGKRRQVAAELAVERIEHALPEEERVCGKCGGRLEKFGEEITRQLDYRPASFYIREHVRFKYACPCCQETVATAEMPSQPIQKGLPGSGLLANVLTSKYCDHLPLYRQEQMYARHGIALSRKTLCDWVKMCARLLEPLYEWMKRDVLLSDIIQTDDTPIAVQDRNREGTRQGRLWVYVGDEDHPHVVYDYTANRSRDGPVSFLEGYSGYLQADAYAGYDVLYRGGEVVEVGCMAHARRKFFDAKSSSPALAHAALAYIGCLYKIEGEAKEHEKENELVGEARAAYRRVMRQERSRPILEQFHDWLCEQERHVLPKSPLGEAIGYALGQWEALNRYIEDGHLEIDNNRAEREIRPLAVGRNYADLLIMRSGTRATFGILAPCRSG